MIRWTYEGFTYVQFGLLQIAANDQLCASGKQYADPPVYHPDVMAWLEAHPHCERWDVGAIGPPGFKFASSKLADEFIARFDPHGIKNFVHAEEVRDMMKPDMAAFLQEALRVREKLTSEDWYAKAGTPEYRELQDDCTRLVSCTEFGMLIAGALRG